MQINATAINSKPPVCMSVAVGTLTLRADDLNDSCALTAIRKALLGDEDYAELSNAIIVAAQLAAIPMARHEPEFTMRQPRKGRQ